MAHIVPESEDLVVCNGCFTIAPTKTLPYKESCMSCSTVVRKFFISQAVGCLLLGLMAATSVALAQTADTGAIAGIVTDAGGGVVPQAEIKVINLGTGESRTA